MPAFNIKVYGCSVSNSINMLCILLLSLLAVLPVQSSPGDDLFEFDNCKFQCEQIVCRNNAYYLQDLDWNYNPSWKFDPLPLAKHLEFLLWDCESNCDYECQQKVTADRVHAGEEVLQFHGKWPFLRVYGIQEFVSVIFSVGNFIVHLMGLIRLLYAVSANSTTDRRIINREYYVLMVITVITMLAWVFSTIFHIRDFEVTEKLDYYFAGLTVLSGFYGICGRVFRLYLPEMATFRLLLTTLCIAAYSGHIYRLETDWLYTYNMQANITVGVLQNLLWVFGCFRLYNKYYNQENENKSHVEYVRRILVGSFFTRSAKLYSLYPLLLCQIVVFGMSLEIFDFAPVVNSLVDAHSLWHLVTIVPPLYGWYDWMVWDLNENVYGDLRERKVNERKKVE